MKITEDHWLENAIRKPLEGGSAMSIRRFLVIHFTAGATGESSIDFWKSPEAKGACAHIVIERDGTIKQCRPFNRTCGHAGVSSWAGFNGLNACAIGIELANAGDDDDALSWARKQPGFKAERAKHKNGGPLVAWECYPAAQLEACKQLSKVLVERYKLDDVVGHEDIAPKRKNDPGPLYPMAELRKFCGIDKLL